MSADRCTDCGLPFPNDHVIVHDDHQPCCDEFCWREYHNDICQSPKDWRAMYTDAVRANAILIDVLRDRLTGDKCP